MTSQILIQGYTLEQLADALKPLLVTSTPTAPTEPENEFITREQACELLSINKTSLWKHTKSGRLKSYGIGNRVLYRRDEVLQAVKPINH
ncbi:excisionase family DNA binding protein [Flavobacterium sp. PL11]|jgi:excisionase family DNA binding protein|uniref:helix-turn-helix domain-containing protein n=1 Tax=Flavobacterium sp. PL11 TaxID=3071717 RepID=UPI002DFC93BF|nr:excisionase family DNA binding protein [Flavobacterium sp. PL11]